MENVVHANRNVVVVVCCIRTVATQAQTIKGQRRCCARFMWWGVCVCVRERERYMMKPCHCWGEAAGGVQISVRSWLR